MTTTTLKLNTTKLNTTLAAAPPVSRAVQAARRAHLRGILTQTLEVGSVLGLLGSYIGYIAHTLAHLV